MCSQKTLNEILHTLQQRLSSLLGASMKETILFGSYARKDSGDGSDIDVMILCDMDRQDIAGLNWRLGEIVSDIMLEHGIIVKFFIGQHLLPMVL